MPLLNVLTSEGHPPRGDLMEKAVNYLKSFRNQIFAYLKDGRYSIDNTIAERFIRPLVGERKNPQQPDGACGSRLAYFDIHLPGQRNFRPGLFEEIFLGSGQSAQGL